MRCFDGEKNKRTQCSSTSSLLYYNVAQFVYYISENNIRTILTSHCLILLYCVRIRTMAAEFYRIML